MLGGDKRLTTVIHKGNLMQPVNIFWFRRDLRLEDNTGLYHALRGSLPVILLFIFDTNILDQLEEKRDQRVEFIHLALAEMQQQLVQTGATLEVYHGSPEAVFRQLSVVYAIETVYANHDYEKYAVQRDAFLLQWLSAHGIALRTYKDQVIFEKAEIIKADGHPYTVYTPYSRKWKESLAESGLPSYPSEKYLGNVYRQPARNLPSLASLGFQQTGHVFPPKHPDASVLRRYSDTRDFPFAEGTSKMGVHLRFGTISIRRMVALARETNVTFLNELIWREFYMSIIWHFPYVGEGKSFKPAYDHILWRNDAAEFEQWCRGATGYPIVDAGMRQLNQTGYMHNRVRMITASFLCKHLLIDWRWGEAYFSQKLLDFDFAANNGGWQWVAGCGCDAAPYFRIFNPQLQTEKFDPALKYIKRWLPEWGSRYYPPPIVEHAFARERCLKAYKEALENR